MGTRSHFDPIAMLDDAYRPRGAAVSWLRANAPAIAAGFDELGIGCLSYFVRDQRFEPADAAYQGGHRKQLEPSLALDVLRRGAARASASQACSALRRMQLPGVHGVIETFGEKLFPMDAFEAPIADAPALMIPTGERLVAVVVAFSRRIVHLSREQQTLWESLALHLGAACRLSTRTPSPDAPDVEAVLDPGGRVLDARGPARDPLARDVLRDAVIRRRRAQTRSARRSPLDALAHWPALSAGRWSLVDLDSDRRLVLARRNDPKPPWRGMPRRQRQVLFYASLGWSIKQIAYALGLTEGTISTHLTIALRKQGYASRAELLRDTAERTMQLVGGAPARRDLGLTPAEFAIAARVTAGWSNRRIAQSRGVSPNTVANQLAGIYRKLGIRDRYELVREVTRSHVTTVS